MLQQLYLLRKLIFRVGRLNSETVTTHQEARGLLRKPENEKA
jgi:hypothetical protein